MKLFVRIVKFLLLASLYFSNISVRAQEIEVVEEPDKCLLMASRCGVKALSLKPFRLPVGTSSVFMKKDSMALRVSGSEISLLEGEFWVQSVGPLTVKDAFGTLESNGSEFLVNRTANKLEIQVAKGSVTLKPKGREPLEVKAGFTNWLGPVNKEKKAQLGISTSIVSRPFLKTWSQYFLGTKKDFEEEADEFYEQNLKASDLAAELQKKAIEDAEHGPTSKYAEEKHQKEIEAQRKKLRELYWKRTFE